MRRGDDALGEYLSKEISGVRESAPAGLSAQSNVTLGDIIGDDGLLLPQRWKFWRPANHGKHSLGNVLDPITNQLSRSGSVVILGEAGVGKSLTLARLFASTAKRYFRNPNGALVPVLVHLDSINFGRGRVDLSSIGAMISKLRLLFKRIPVDWAIFSRAAEEGHLLLLLDGLDELPGSQDPAITRRNAQFFTLELPTVITCRTDYYSLYISGSQLDRHLKCKIQLLSMPFDDRSEVFIDRFCALTGSGNSVEIKRVIAGQTDLREACANPLILNMAVDVIDDQVSQGGSPHALTWTKSRLYRKYTRRWLENEASKTDSRLRWDQKDYLVRLVARAMFCGGRVLGNGLHGAGQQMVITQDQLARVLDSDKNGLIPATKLYFSMSLRDLTDEICFRTFLIRAAEMTGTYRFIHKSFWEFYLAFDIWDRLREVDGEVRPVAEAFKRPLPDPVVFFFRDLLATSREQPDEAHVVFSNLLRLFRTAKKDSGPIGAAIRQHAGNFMPIVASTVEVNELLLELDKERDQFVRRGIIIGLAMHKNRLDLVEQYVRQLRHDRHARQVQLGYSRIYRGDQVYKGEWIDDGTPGCDHTIDGYVEHLESGRYPNLTGISLYMLRALIEDGRGEAWLSSHPEVLSRLRSSLLVPRIEFGEVFEEERLAIAPLLESISRGEPIKSNLGTSEASTAMDTPNTDHIGPTASRFAVMIGIETYQNPARIGNAKYAENDARGFSAALIPLGFDQASQVLLVNEYATKATIESNIKKILETAFEKDVIFIFYAGHGFSKNGENYITCYDTQPDDWVDTSVSLQSLYDLMEKSKSQKIAVFLDSCASGLTFDKDLRDIYSMLSEAELKEFFSQSEYRVCFSSCKANEGSSSSDQLKHGIWTYHVIRAFSGEDQKALRKKSLLTANSLQDYLSLVVPATIRSSYKSKRVQTPWFYGAQSRDFLLADLTEILHQKHAVQQSGIQDYTRIWLRGLESCSIKALTGWKKHYKVPSETSDYTDRWVKDVASNDVDRELEFYFQKMVKHLYKRSELEVSDPDQGAGSIITPGFDFHVSVCLDPEDSSEVIFQRTVTDIRDAQVLLSSEFDEVFHEVFSEIEYQSGKRINIKQLVFQLEEANLDNVTVDAPRDCSQCTIHVDGLDHDILVHRSSLTIKFQKPITSKGLIEAFVKTNFLLVGNNIKLLLPKPS